MSNKFLLTLSLTSVFILTTGIVNAYPQTMFGTGYGFSNTTNINNGAVYSRAINQAAQDFSDKSTTSVDYTNDGEKNVSTIIGNPDEAANAGYKTKTFWTKNDGKDYNPYTGASSGVNESQSIYTDDLGRIHFFGKDSRINK